MCSAASFVLLSVAASVADRNNGWLFGELDEQPRHVLGGNGEGLLQLALVIFGRCLGDQWEFYVAQKRVL